MYEEDAARLVAICKRNRAGRDEPGVAEIVGLVRHRGDPRAAWEALFARGHLPEAWLRDDARRFALPRQFYRRRRAREALAPDELERVEHVPGRALEAARLPMSLEWMAALVADRAGLETAEALAVETLGRLHWWDRAPESGENPRRLVWREARRTVARAPVVPAELTGWDYALTLAQPWLRGWPPDTINRRAREQLEATLGGVEGWRRAWTDVRSALRELAFPETIDVLVSAAMVSRIVRAHATLDPPLRRSEIVRGGRPVADEPTTASITDPFEPWLELLAHRYVLVSAHRGAVVLGTPRATAVPAAPKK